MNEADLKGKIPDNNPKKTNTFVISLKSMFLGQKRALSTMEEELVQSPGRTVIRNFFKRKLSIIGLVGIGTVVLMSLLLPVFFPVDLTFQDTSMMNVPPSNSMMRVPPQIRSSFGSLSPGSGFGIGTDANGRLFMWGVLSDQLRQIPFISGNIVQVSGGFDHAMALTEDGHVYAWGNPHFSQGIITVPQQIQGRVAYIVAGFQFSMAITTDGTVHAWGNQALLAPNLNAMLAMPLGAISQIAVNSISGGALNYNGELRILSPRATIFSEVPAEIQGHITSFALTDRQGAAVLDDGTVVAWGANEPALFVPDHIQGRALDIQSGRGHFTVLLDDGTVESWGNNYYGQASSPNISNVVAIIVNYHHNYAITENGNIYTWGLNGFLFGTDTHGRDIFARTFAAGRISLFVGVIAVVVSAIIGIILGGLAGYYAGKTDMFVMRLSEVLGSIPFLPLAIILLWTVAREMSEVQRLIAMMFVLGVLTWPPLMRLVRGQILQVRENEYVTAARSLGVKENKIIFKHIMPNIMSNIIVWATLALSAAVLIETTLSFIGFGINEPTPTWGNMLTGANNSVVLRQQWWRWVFPAIALVTTTLSINILGDGLREAMDPKTRGR